MSGVLDRMVQRARGTLPAAEPRIAPASAAFVMPEEEAWQGEVLVKSEQRSDAPAARLRAQPDQPGGDHPSNDQPSLAGPVLRRPVSQAERSTQIALPGTSADERTAVAATAGRTPAAIATPDLVRFDPEAGGRGAPQSPQHQVVPEPPRQMAERGPQAASTRDPVVESGRHAPASQVDERPQTIHEHREITISIGRISMEAAPQPQVKTPAAFRPRVTLDAFLQGRQEGRR